MSSPRLDGRVDEYIDRLPEWQQENCRQVRAVVHAADPEVEEPIKGSVRRYFVHQGRICALLAVKDYVNVFSTTQRWPTQRASSNATARSVQNPRRTI